MRFISDSLKVPGGRNKLQDHSGIIPITGYKQIKRFVDMTATSFLPICLK
jgi:hypothetical protein